MFSFFKTIFSEDNGNGSWARVGSFISLVAVICWVTHCVLHNHAVPDLTGPGIFISTPYGANLIHSAVTANKQT